MLYEILRAERFDADGVGLAGTVRVWDEVVSGLEWILAHSPEYYQVTETALGLRTAFTSPELLGVRVRVHYRILNDHQVELVRAFA